MALKPNRDVYYETENGVVPGWLERKCDKLWIEGNIRQTVAELDPANLESKKAKLY